jgi:hypothetical protein
MGYETLRPEIPYLHAGNCGIVTYVLIFRDAINASAGNARTAYVRPAAEESVVEYCGEDSYLRGRCMSSDGPLFDNFAILDDPELTCILKEAEAAGEFSAELDGKLEARLEAIFDQLPVLMGAGLFERLKANTPEMLADRFSIREGFLGRQRQKWGSAFDKLRALLEAASESGSEFNMQFASDAAKDNDYLFDALRRLHARSCLITHEVLWMMEGGFAAGAMARWRTVHELAMVALFLREHGQEMAERYLLHNVIESYDSANQYQQYYRVLGRDPVPTATLRGLEAQRRQLCNRFGQAYGHEWGWAARIIRPPVNVGKIERSLNMSHMRPYFRMACYGNHASSRGLRFDLGNALVPPGKEVLLAGPSDAGFYDPGCLTAVSLVQVTVCLLIHHLTITGLTMLNAMDRMVAEVEEAFADAEAKLAEEAERMHAAGEQPAYDEQSIP